MNVRYKDKELFDSRSFITFGLGETRVDFSDGKETLAIILDFREIEKEKPAMRFEVIDTQTVKLVLTNFGTLSGAGFKEPVDLGTLSHRRIYFLLHVVPIGAIPNCKSVNLSLYLGEGVQDGKN